MSRPVPREVYIEPTNRCNELCQTCPRTFFTREPEADLDLERFLGILDQFPGVERVVLHGVGEPLLAPDLPAMVAEANRRGARVLFNTNALALHRRLAERLVAAGLDELRISMDAADRRTYLAIRGVDGYEKAMRRTADFCRLLRELADCRTAGARWGVELAGTGGLSPAESLTPVDLRRPWSGCTRPWRSTYVTANGNVLPCCFAPFTTSDYDGVVLGNVF